MKASQCEICKREQEWDETEAEEMTEQRMAEFTRLHMICRQTIALEAVAAYLAKKENQKEGWGVD